VAVDIDRAKSLGRLRELVAADVTLIQDGNRWSGLCPFHDEKTPSFGIFFATDGTEKYHCFGCNATGDVLDYVMETRGVGLREANEIITGESDDGGARHQPKPLKPPPDPYADVTPITPIPKGTRRIKPGTRIRVWNPKRERYTNYTPTLAHLYKSADGGAYGYVLRMDMNDGRKITPKIMWCERPGVDPGWSHYEFPEPRPLYGVERITTRGQILVVEGEKTADAAQALLKMHTVTWGGTSVVDKTDWSPLAGRDIILWPDADGPGRAATSKIALILHRQGAKRIRIIDTTGQPDGWDAADAAEEGWDREQTLEWLREQATAWNPPPEPEPETTPATQQAALPPGDGEDWRENVIYNAEGGPKAKSVHNYITFLSDHPDLAETFYFDEFALEILVKRCPPWDDPETYKPHTLTDKDVIFCQAQLEHYGLSPTKDAARSAIIAAASKRAFHPAREFLTELEGKWDGKKRLDGWLTYYMGVEPTEFSALVGRKWLVAAVRRVFEPGCKFDTMLILEGPQNIGKSLALQKLATFGGVAYFTDAIQDIHSKEASMMMQGVFIVEMAELNTLRVHEINDIKAWITRQIDQYRPPFGTSILKAPRQCVLAGTVNPTGGYLKDSTGNRRFWPVWSASVDFEAIENDREQIWAEAVAVHLTGEPLYLVGDEIRIANEQQKERFEDDIWADDIDQYVATMDEVTVREILHAVLEIPKERRSKLQEARVARHLGHRGWTRKKRPVGHDSNRLVWKYVRPEEEIRDAQ